MSKKSVKLRVLPKIQTIAQLRILCSCPPTPFDVADRHCHWAMIAAENLGGPADNWKEAIQTLMDNAMETDEAGVVAEINHVRDIEAEEWMKRR